MLQIGYLLICEDVIQNNDQTILKKPLSALTPISLPGNYSFKVAFSLHNFEEKDFGKENKLRLTFKDPDNDLIVDTGVLNFGIGSNQKPLGATLESSEADIGLTNVELFKKGLHTLTLTVNDESKELKIPVLKKIKLGESNGKN